MSHSHFKGGFRVTGFDSHGLGERCREIEKKTAMDGRIARSHSKHHKPSIKCSPSKRRHHNRCPADLARGREKRSLHFHRI